MPLSTWGENTLASIITGQTTPLTSLYIALLNQIPGPDDDGTTIAAWEPNVYSYSRYQILLDGFSWGTPVGGEIGTATPITFYPYADWGTLTAYALCDSDTGGNVFGYEYLTNPVTIKANANVTSPGPVLQVI
jgi:hypothetical protein